MGAAETDPKQAASVKRTSRSDPILGLTLTAGLLGKSVDVVSWGARVAPSDGDRFCVCAGLRCTSLSPIVEKGCVNGDAARMTITIAKIFESIE